MTQRKIKREKDTLKIVSWLWMMPLLSLPELATVTCLTHNRCYRLMKTLQQEGRVASVRLGMTMELRDRWFLTTSGVKVAMERLGYSLEWQVCESGLKLLIRRLPTLETVYTLAPGLWELDGVEHINPIYLTSDPDDVPLEFPRDLRITGFHWQRDSDIHAISQYANEAWVPWVWVGTMTKRTMMQHKMLNALFKLAMRSWTTEEPHPAGWVVVGGDFLAAAHASGEWKSDDVLVMTAERETLKSMRPHEFTRPYLENARPTDLGVPERIPAWVETDPVVRALNGKLNYALFQLVCQWSGMRVGQIHDGFSHSHGEINAGLKNLERAGMIVRLNRAYYLPRTGMLAAARMDRISHQSIYGSFDGYLAPDGNYRRTRQRHDQAVADFVLASSGYGYDTFHGRRHVMNLASGGQVAPDAVVAWKRQDGTVEYWFVEVELSAKAPSSVREKLRHYRAYQQQHVNSVNLMVVVGTDAAENNFLKEGRGLTILTTTLGRFLKSGPKVNPWRRP